MTAVSAFIERTMASRQFSDDELKCIFDEIKRDYSNDFILMFLQMHIETMERCVQLETRVKALEARKR
jgi:hypothetical protein